MCLPSKSKQKSTQTFHKYNFDEIKIKVTTNGVNVCVTTAEKKSFAK